MNEYEMVRRLFHTGGLLSDLIMSGVLAAWVSSTLHLAEEVLGIRGGIERAVVAWMLAFPAVVIVRPFVGGLRVWICAKPKDEPSAETKTFCSGDNA